jgi:L-malate glycosyltransferase
MPSLSIAHVSTQRGWHGGEEQARLLCEGLRRLGHENIVFAKRGGRFAERMRTAGFDVRPLPGSGRGPRAIWQLWRAGRKLRPAVVHFHDPHALSGAGLAMIGAPIAARVVARRVDFPIRSVWRYRHLVDRVISVSTAVAQVCRTSGVPGEKIRIVHDGVDPGRAESGNRQRGRSALGLADDAVLLLTVATLTDHKGHTYLLQALPALRSALGNRQVVVALAGDGELRAALELEARQRGVDEMVRFLGYRNDIPDLLKAADVFVLPSHLEGLCSTLIDAMFARVPIVATTAGGIPDLLGARNGAEPVALLAPPRAPAMLASAMIAATLNRDRFAGLVERAQARAQADFTAQQMVAGTLAVYQEVLRTKQSRATGSGGA